MDIAITANAVGVKVEPKPKRMDYRPDVDGLRAIAVLLVVLYHLHTAKCIGGFIGVDVFFVISGYLLSSLILADLGAGRFSLVDFYERRIRRIFPALIVLLCSVTTVGYVVLLPVELKNYAESLLAATFSTSNFYFWRHTGYFDATTSTSPLLHTWSLAVEEQFYLVLPLSLMLLWRLPRRRLIQVLCLIAVLSLILSSIGAAKNEASAFYLLHSRAWELLLGTLTALWPVGRRVPAVVRNLAAFVGLVLIVGPGFVYSVNTPFPGLAAVLPCLGTALVIFAGAGAGSRLPFVNRLLSLRPMRWIGLISYSLYLWHWPLIVFARTDVDLSSNIPPRLLKLGLFVLSIGIAFLSWRFVETPFRFGRFRPSGRLVFRFALAGTAMVAMVASGLIVLKGIPTRWSGEAVRLAGFLDYKPEDPFRQGTCFIDGDRGDRYDAATCLKQKSTKRNYLLVGDSHAASLWYGLSKTFPDLNIMQATAAGCLPLLQDRRTSSTVLNRVSRRLSSCEDLMSFLYTDYLISHPPDTLAISAKWGFEDLELLHRTLQWATSQGIRVVLFGPMVEYDTPLPRLLAVSIQRHDSSVPSRHMLMSNWLLDREMAKLAKSEANVRYISLITPVCAGRTCASYADPGVPLEFDSNHFTSGGSLFVAQWIRAEGGL